MKQGTIYKITSPSNKIYIGQTINIKNRINKYKCLSCKGQPKLYNSLKKYNWNLHTFEILETCLSDDNLNEREIYWITFYDSFKNGLNCNQGGNGNKNEKLSEETKRKISETQKRKKTWVGRKHKEETKEKIKKNNIGKILSEETKEKIRQANLGKKQSEETKNKKIKAALGKKRGPYKKINQ